ncbi:hypothetical protein [Streptomyces sp. NPDC003077]|uniref:TlpA family protein disulfide reductase n=1 Tax=Streptomyces sp. NPDC003077 TaxID=3154443 RepID=UPI0033A86CFC
MPVLVPVVVLVGVLGAVNLVLALGIVKRLREHGELLANGNTAVNSYTINVGESVGAFRATTVDGEPVTQRLAPDDETLTPGDTLVAILSPTCGPCKEKLPKLLDYIAYHGIPREQVLAAVVGDPDEATAFVDALRPSARVVVEESDGALSTAFQVKAFPTLLRVSSDGSGGAVVTDNDVRLGVPATAAA